MHDRKTTRERLSRATGTPPATMRHVAHLFGAALLALGLATAHAQSAGAAEAAQPRAFAVQLQPLALPAAVGALPAVSPSRGAADALGDARLDNLRGGTETPWSDMRLSGTVGGNAATNVVTGANTITDGAFANASGLPMVIQNSGANVLIQNATIVNVQIQ